MWEISRITQKPMSYVIFSKPMALSKRSESVCLFFVFFPPFFRVLSRASSSAYRPDGTALGFAHIQFEKQDDAVAACDSAAKEPMYILGRNVRIDFASQKVKSPPPNNKLYFSQFYGDEEDLRKATREFESSIISYFMRKLPQQACHVAFLTSLFLFLVKDVKSGQPTGTGFIEFMSVERATDALEQLGGMVLSDGKKFSLSYAKPRLVRNTDGNQRGRRAGFASDWGGSNRSNEYRR
jgi:RNA recognition motif-containing protein